MFIVVLIVGVFVAVVVVIVVIVVIFVVVIVVVLSFFLLLFCKHPAEQPHSQSLTTHTLLYSSGVELRDTLF